MVYDFDEVIDRRGQHAAKYEELEKKFGRSDIIPLWVADMDFRAPAPVIDALTEKARHGIFGYTYRPDSYFQAVCDWQKRRNGWEIDASLASFCVGVVPALSVIVHEFTDPGDSVLIQTPVYPEFEESISAWGRRTLVAPLAEENGRYSVDFAVFEKALKESPRLFILCSPHNPVGRVWSEQELTRMCELCIAHGVTIVSDEIHSDLILWGGKFIPTAALSPEIASHTISCTSGTKTFNLAGLQASTIVFPKREWKKRFDGFWANFDIHRNNSFSVVAMEAAFRHGDEWLEQLTRYIEGNVTFVRDWCRDKIPRIKANVPESTYLIWLDCRELGLSDDALFDFMVNDARLALGRGIAFGKGGEGFMRLNAACPRSVLARALEQLETAVNGMKG